MTQENSAKVSFILVVFLGLLTAITPLATDLYLPALPIMPSELNYICIKYSNDHWCDDFWCCIRSIIWRSY